MRCTRWQASVSVSALVVVAAVFLHAQLADDRVPTGGDPYSILGLANGASQQHVTKAYRSLAKRWHPDRMHGDKDVFALVAHAYDVLTDPEKRDVFDRLGARGLERLRDGDPSVRKDWLSDAEILRRVHNDGDEGWLDGLVTSGFASLSAGAAACSRRLAPSLRWLTGREWPSVVITASDGDGSALYSGGATRGGATFRFDLSGRSSDFELRDVTHNCDAARAKFLGIKATYYLQCAHEPGRSIAVHVAPRTFTVADRTGDNTASNLFELEMV